MRPFGVWVAIASLSGCVDVPLPSLIGDASGRYQVLPRPPCDARVWTAVQTVDEGAVRRLSREGVSFSCGDVDVGTPLEKAIYDDRLDVVRALLEGGANPNLRSWRAGDRHPLQAAIEARTYVGPRQHTRDIVGLLIAHGVDVNARWCPFESRTPGGPVPPCVAATGITPLMGAAYLNQPEVAELLLDAGADPTPTNNEGLTALEMTTGEAVFASILRRAFARESDAVLAFAGRFPPPYRRNSDGETMLTRAIDERRYGEVRLLLAAGAGPNDAAASARRGEATPLVRALAWPAGLTLLLAHGADPNARSCPRADGPGRPAADSATLNLLGSAAAEACSMDRGATALMLAAGEPVISRLLLDHGADPGLTDWEGRTAADYGRAAEERRRPILKSR